MAVSLQLSVFSRAMLYVGDMFVCLMGVDFMTRQANVTPTTLLALLILRVGWFERSETQHTPSKPLQIF
ncbi:hypothetical protein NQS96_16820 [Pseudoalteromonas shioyasakiensis]|uniref:hypothetical protein n=1 Tax=Pseudoalteromonas shioyasakiensis TaxID=1190813 RepID=UPI0021192C94|nr:hypothetical protein [Pseudoalteromonas shioyasakiensis]MCQ8883439.1 hypothetical protein [Pseudoalteromonas shioyasakiensis]